MLRRTAHPEDQGVILCIHVTAHSLSSREFSALFWFLQALHACGLCGLEGLPSAQD